MTRRSVARQGLSLLATACAACLWGCASLNPDTPPPPPENTPQAQAAEPAPASASAPATPGPATVAYRVEVQAPPNLRQLLLTYLDLVRFQNAPQAEGITNAELIRLTAASPSQARSLLETEGYFNAQIGVTRIDPPDETPLITLNVAPGPRTLIGQWELTVTGELKTRIDAGDADALDLIERLRKRWPLAEGQPFSQSAWNSAKNGTLAQLRAEGYPAAKA
ncbi:MAG TPA: hypothetical protein VGD46_12690, partial [Rhizobacter sp.]